MTEIRMRAKYVSIEHASARAVAERFRAQYEKQPGEWYSLEREEAYKKLLSIGPDDIEKAATIIGNQSWSYLSCDGCSDYILRGVRIGYEYSDGKLYCQTCIAEANAILQR